MTEENKTKEEEVIAQLDTFDELPDCAAQTQNQALLGGEDFGGYRSLLAGDLLHRSVDCSLS